MGLGKQAKTLSKAQTDAVLGYLAKTRWPTRNRVIFLLSVSFAPQPDSCSVANLTLSAGKLEGGLSLVRPGNTILNSVTRLRPIDHAAKTTRSYRTMDGSGLNIERIHNCVRSTSPDRAGGSGF